MPSDSVQQRKHAIVIGASMGGLLTARVLSNYFDKVTIIEKDVVHRVAESRKGQPHTRHLHGLLPSGLQIILKYFPGLRQEMIDHGGLRMPCP